MNETQVEHEQRADRRPLLLLLIRISVYYGVLAVLGLATNAVLPEFIEQLPVGGISVVAGEDPAVLELEEALLSADNEAVEEITAPGGTGRLSDAYTLLLAMTCSIVLMLPVAWMYKCIHVEGEHDHSLDETALILPAVVAGIVMIVQHSLALAFSLAGIVAGVRFRRSLSDTFDTLFIFVAIGVGIAAGIGAIEVAAVMTIFFNYATIGTCLFGDGLESQYTARRKTARRARKLADLHDAGTPIVNTQDEAKP